MKHRLVYCTIGCHLSSSFFSTNFHKDSTRQHKIILELKKVSDFWQLHNVKAFGESQQNETKKLLVSVEQYKIGWTCLKHLPCLNLLEYFMYLFIGYVAEWKLISWLFFLKGMWSIVFQQITFMWTEVFRLVVKENENFFKLG